MYAYLYQIAFRVSLKIYRIGLLLTLEHDNFDMVFMSDSYRGAEVLKKILYVSDKLSRRLDC